ncbi:MAG: Npt1/Npt2 family nucleotide transporter [Bacteroidota bacterium]
MESNKEFGRLRSVIFPIYRHELRKFIPLALIFFVISLNYSVLRNVKDLFIFSTGVGETINYIKTVGVLPFTIILTIIYGRISRMVDRDTRFVIVVSYFLVFFGFFYFFLYPNMDRLVLYKWLGEDTLKKYARWQGFLTSIKYWPFSLLYMNAEAWGTFVLGISFWTFANEITSSEQAKRIYSFLSLSSGAALIVSGIFLTTLANLNLLVGLTFLLMLLLLGMYVAFARDIRKNPSLYRIAQKQEKKKKVKKSFIESLKFLAKSNYLPLIAILVISYGMVINFFESVWKVHLAELGNALGDSSVSKMIYAKQSIYTGVLLIFFVTFLASPIIARGWRFAASVTPIVALVATLFFFSTLYFKDSLGPIAYSLGSTPALLAAEFGLVNVVFIKSAKYVLFDPTKERAYIPLDEESKTQGKAAVDGVGSRLGKGLSSLILSAYLIPQLGGGSIIKVQYLIFFIILLALVGWLAAISRLSVKFHEFTKQEPLPKAP